MREVYGFGSRCVKIQFESNRYCVWVTGITSSCFGVRNWLRQDSGILPRFFISFVGLVLKVAYNITQEKLVKNIIQKQIRRLPSKLLLMEETVLVTELALHHKSVVEMLYYTCWKMKLTGNVKKIKAVEVERK